MLWTLHILFLRYGNTWGDWHGGNGGTDYGPYEIVLIGAKGIINQEVDDEYVSAIVFWGNDGTTYGPFGGSGGKAWKTTFNSTLGKASDYYYC